MLVTSLFEGDWAEALCFWNSLDPCLVSLGLSAEPEYIPCPVAAKVVRQVHAISRPSIYSPANPLVAVVSNPTVMSDVDISEKINGIHLALLNVRSLVKHGMELADLITEGDIDLMCVTESWLHDAANHAAGLATPVGFQLLRADRLSGMGGGVAAFLREGWDVHTIPTEGISNCEHLLFKIALDHNTTLTCLIIYRPPPDMPLFKDQLLGLISVHLTTKSKFLLVGDFNYWANDPNDAEGCNLLTALEALGFTQHVQSATHEHGHTLDWVLTQNIDISSLDVLPCIWSDHMLIRATIPLSNILSKPVAKRKVIKRRNLKNIDSGQFVRALQPSLHKLLALNDIDKLATDLRRLLNNTTDQLAPEKLKVVKTETKDKGWFSDNIISARTLKRKAEANWRRNPTETFKTVYKQAASHYKQQIVRAKSDFYNTRILTANSNSRELFKIVKELETRETSQEELAVSEEWCQSIQDTLFQKVEKHVKIISGRRSSLLPCTDFERRALGQTQVCPAPSFSFRAVSVSEVTDTVLKLKPTSYKGDVCPAELIQKSISVLAPVLTHLVNISFSTGIVPSSIKESWITPLLKKVGLDAADPLNYRPITNVSFILKILDKLAFIQVQEFLELHQLLNGRQSGFRRGFGTESALLDLKNSLASIIDDGKPALLLLLDLSAAFDLVDHNLLVDRLTENFSFSGKAAGWIQSFLSDRTAKVCIGAVSAKPAPLSRGVPQGSCLSPTLYNMYTRPLFDALERVGVGFTNYADDTQLFIPLSGSYEADAASIAKIYGLIQRWMAVNGLALNGDKTEILILGTRTKVNSLTADYASFVIEGCDIPVAKVVKTLGVYLDSHLTMQNQVGKVKSSCAYIIKLLNQIKRFLSMENLARVAGALINSRLDYCNSLLAGADNKVIHTLQVIQNNAVRAVTGTARREHISEARRGLHWLPVKQRISHKINTLVFKCLHNAAPAYLSNAVSAHKTIRTLRSANEIRLTQPRFNLKTFGGRSFSVQAALLWNKLPKDLRGTEPLEAFRKKLKTVLFSGVT